MTPLQDQEKLFSVVIPVFNSGGIITETVQRTLQYFASQNRRCEIILVNDGSHDSSWDEISGLAQKHKDVKAINLLRNYGQHSANLCGFRETKGDYVITMDDDLQNPPEEIEKLIQAIGDDHDLVIGRFKEKKHSWARRTGSKVIGFLNRHIFPGQPDFILTNFRILRRDVVDRVNEYRSHMPYIPGLILICSTSRKNVMVEHHPRKSGKSNYSVYQLARLVSSIVFNYSSIPLRLMAGLGFLISMLSLLLSVYYLAIALISGINVPGWTTLVVLLSFFNGILILIISVVGEYIIRLVKESTSNSSYYIKDIVG